MVVGFLKGIWGKPAVKGTGMIGLWGTVTSVPKKIVGAVVTPFKLFGTLLITLIGIFIYSRMKK